MNRPDLHKRAPSKKKAASLPARRSPSGDRPAAAAFSLIERQFRETFDLAGVGIAHLAPDGTLLRANQVLCDIVGYNRDELRTRKLHDLTHAGEREEDRAEYGTLLGGKVHALSREQRLVRKDGFTVWVSSTVTAVRKPSGAVAYCVAVIEDITGRKRMEDALRLLQTTVESLPVGITIADLDGRILYLNRAVARMHGYEAAELLGREARTLAPDEERGSMNLRELLAGGRVGREPYTREVMNQRKDGSVFPALLVSVPVRDMRGNPIALVTVSDDITERKTFEKALYLAKRDWEGTFDSITDMITIHDRDFNIVRANKAAADILGFSWLTMKRSKCYEYYHGSASPPEGCPSCQSLLTGAPSIQERYEPHLGKFLEVRAIPRLDASGGIVGLVHIVRDISERKRAEAEKAALEARLSEAQRMETIGSLAGGVAHEVRNPLNAIMALTDALDREIGENAEYRTFMQHMRTQVDRLSNLMNDLLDLGKPVDRAKLRTESLTEICAVSVDAWKQSKWGRGRDVATSLSTEGQGTYVLADAKKLQQVFINLLDNAAQHSPDGAAVRIEVPPPAEGKVTVRIVDRGSGIAADMLPRVFDTFFTTRRGGTGLGLSIVKHIVEKHGGTITLMNNDPPPGCAAVVELPVLQEHT